MYAEVISAMMLIPGYKDADEIQAKAARRQQEIVFDMIYDEATKCAEIDTREKLNEAIEKFSKITSWKDSASKIEECQNRINEIKAEIEAKNKKSNKILLLVLLIGALISLIIWGGIKAADVLKVKNQYNRALAAYNQGDYLEAISEFEKLGEYSNSKEMLVDSHEMLAKSQFEIGKELIAEGKFDDGIEKLKYAKELSVSYSCNDEITIFLNALLYERALQLFDEENYVEAGKFFSQCDLPEKKQYLDYIKCIEDVQAMEEGTNLSALYGQIVQLNNFNNADRLISDNPYLSVIKESIGTWYATEAYGRGNDFKERRLRMEISLNGEVHDLEDANWHWDETDKLYIFVLHSKRIYLVLDDYKSVNRGKIHSSNLFEPEGNVLKWRDGTFAADSRLNTFQKR